MTHTDPTPTTTVPTVNPAERVSRIAAIRERFDDEGQYENTIVSITEGQWLLGEVARLEAALRSILWEPDDDLDFGVPADIVEDWQRILRVAEAALTATTGAATREESEHG